MLLQQLVQPGKPLGLARIKQRQDVLDGCQVQGLARLYGQFLFQAGGQGPGIGLIGQGAEAVGQLFEGRMQAQDIAVVPGADREAVLVVLDKEAALGRVKPQGQVAALQGLTVIAAEEGHQQLALEQRVGGVPLDIEEFAVRAQAPPFQQIQPPGVIAATDGHVVGHDIQNQPHLMGAQGRHQATQGGFAAQFRVDGGRVDHVVAMH